MQSLFSGGLFLVVEGDNSLGEVSVWMGFFFFFFLFSLVSVLKAKMIREKTKDKESVVWKGEEG